MQSQAPLASLLVLPDGAVNRRMGGGQRSALIFEALSRLGPVDVVVLGAVKDSGKDSGKGAGMAADPALQAAFFPGAASVTRLQSARFPVRPRGRLARLAGLAARFLRVVHHYRPEPPVVAGLAQILRPDHRVVAFRYALPFCVSGLEARPEGLVLCVDIDDRDDQKFASAARQGWRQGGLGQGLLGRLFAGWVLPRLRRRLEAALGQADLLWYAAPEDVLPLQGARPPRVEILGNVPFFAVPGDLPPPSASRDLLFVGTAAHRPNAEGVAWFLRQCWPALQARHPDSRLRIVGLGDWAALGRQFPGPAGVDYIGTVPEVAPEYARARLVISPVFEGGGSKIKLVEACAFGRPVVAPAHSLRGFGPALTGLVPQAETPEAFVAACSALLSDAGAADRLGRALQGAQAAEISRPAAEAAIAAAVLSLARGAG